VLLAQRHTGVVTVSVSSRLRDARALRTLVGNNGDTLPATLSAMPPMPQMDMRKTGGAGAERIASARMLLILSKSGYRTAKK